MLLLSCPFLFLRFPYHSFLQIGSLNRRGQISGWESPKAGHGWRDRRGKAAMVSAVRHGCQDRFHGLTSRLGLVKRRWGVWEERELGEVIVMELFLGFTSNRLEGGRGSNMVLEDELVDRKRKQTYWCDNAIIYRVLGSRPLGGRADARRTRVRDRWEMWEEAASGGVVVVIVVVACEVKKKKTIGNVGFEVELFFLGLRLGRHGRLLLGKRRQSRLQRTLWYAKRWVKSITAGPTATYTTIQTP